MAFESARQRIGSEAASDKDVQVLFIRTPESACFPLEGIVPYLGFSWRDVHEPTSRLVPLGDGVSCQNPNISFSVSGDSANGIVWDALIDGVCTELSLVVSRYATTLRTKPDVAVSVFKEGHKAVGVNSGRIA